MNRRGFLGAMLAAASAPAIVKAESLMRIVVPKREIIVPTNWDKWNKRYFKEGWNYEPGEVNIHDMFQGPYGLRIDRAVFPSVSALFLGQNGY